MKHSPSDPRSDIILNPATDFHHDLPARSRHGQAAGGKLAELAKLANPSGKLTADEAEWRAFAALHEAAHFVASLACPGSFVAEVQVFVPRRYNGGGRMRSFEAFSDEECFVTLAGWAWETAYGNHPAAAQHDWAVEEYRAARFPYVIDDARRFVAEHKEVVEDAAAEILTKARARDGLLTGAGLRTLREELLHRITPFRTRQS